MTTFYKSTILSLFLSIFCCASNTLQAQNLHTNVDFFQIATPNSTLDWIEIKPELQLSLEAFLAQKAALGLSPDDSFVLLKTQKDELGKTHYRYRQTYKGIPVAHAQLLVHVGANGFVETANGRLIRNLRGKTTPAFSAEKALKSYALPYMNAEKYAWEDEVHQKLIQKIKKDSKATFYPEGKLEWANSDFSDKNPDTYHLSYQMDVYAVEPLKNVGLHINAHTGKVVNESTQIYDNDALATGETNYTCLNPIEFYTEHHEDDDISYYTLNNEIGGGIKTYKENFGVQIVDGNNHWDGNKKTAAEVHWAMEQTYYYFLNTHNRNSLDGAGMEITGIIDANISCSAHWNIREGLAKFGIGDAYCPNNSPTSTDIVAHELTHGIIQFSAGLMYKREAGALNESFSDIFGVLVHFEADPDPDCANWVIGDEVYVFDNGIRDLSNPKAFNHPDTYQGLYWKNTNSCNPSPSNDRCGIHTNSGVHNYWFYLLAEGGNGTNDNGYDYDIVGIGKETAAKIAYHNLTVYLSPTSEFVDARNGSLWAAMDLYPDSIEIYEAVKNAWCAVGVGDNNQCIVLNASLDLQSPNGGESWKAGSIETIEWTSAGTIDNVYIDYSINGGSSWERIGNYTPDDGSYEWQIPANLSTHVAKIRIIAANDPTIKDESEAVFGIEACDVLAGFTADIDTYQICVGESLQFSNASINAENYEWQIDGTTLATSTDFSYTFPTAGIFMVNLAAIDVEGCRHDFYEVIEVGAVPDAGFMYEGNGLTLTFMANQMYATNYTWDFGDNTTSNEFHPNHEYAAEGNYTVCLTVENDCGTEEVTECKVLMVMNPPCLVADSLELVRFYEAMRGDYWENNQGWLVAPVSQWYGVTLSDDGCSVTSLYFYDNNLTGELPDLNFPNLTNLSINRNDLCDAIPNFSNLPNLTSLSIWSNDQLSGTIPDFSNLPNLTSLNLGDNQLSGSIPDFSNLSNLISLKLYDNQLSGTIPDFSNLPNLTSLNLDDNQLSGVIPDFSNLDSLTYLNLGDNQLSGSIPDFSNLPKLTSLNLDNNQLRGAIPNFSNLPELTSLQLWINQLSGSIPDFSNLPNLTSLYLRRNQLSGTIPNFSNLTHLNVLWLSDNKLSGTIPNFSNLPNLPYLNLANNQLSGDIPDFTQMPQLTSLNLSGNQLSNLIPDFSNLPNLTSLSLANNQFQGEIPYFSKLDTLLTLDLSYNQFNGTIPNFSNLPYLKNLRLNNNQLSGNIPDFSNLSDLVLLYMRENQLTFEGLAATVEYFNNSSNFSAFSYHPQAPIPLQQQAENLYVSVGGDLNKHTYWWYEMDNSTAIDTIVADSIFTPPSNSTKVYYCEVRDSVATELILSSVPATIHTPPTNCLTSDSLALVDFFLSTGGKNWTNNSGWLEAPVSDWYGVSLHSDGCSIQTLSLHNNNLTGSLPNINLPHLTSLNLYQNQLSGAIPDFSNLPNLTSLSLSRNKLSGAIPDFSNLPNLTSLNLYQNQLSGAIPNFTSLSNLIYLRLYQNQLNGAIPDFTNLSNLTSLRLNQNQLNGMIPDFSNLPKLTSLNFYQNQLNDTIPDFSNLPNLTSISLYRNELSGTIPDFSNLPKLTSLNLHQNQLNDTIPDFTNLLNLTYLNLSYNQLEGNLFDFSNLADLTSLNLSYNQLEGAIPDFSNLSNLTSLNLSSNQLEGTVPDFSNLPDLTYLYLNVNQLTGTIPDFSNLPDLTYLYLNDNQLTGTIPDFSNLPDLTYLYLNDNQLNGNIFNFSSLPSLTRLYLSNNQLSGAIPDFSNLPNLFYLYLNNNQFNDSIPNFSNIPDLYYLYLNNNQLSGIIPNFSSLPNLYQLHLDNNQLNGAIPNFTHLENVREIDLSKNQLSDTIPNFSNLSNLYKLSLNNNQLSGELPSFSNCSSLYHLYVQQNQLSGIPIDFFDTKNISFFYLYGNQLTFDGLEENTNGIFYSFYYASQAPIPTHQLGDNQLYVSAGGTHENNTYNWYETGSWSVVGTDSILTVPNLSKSYYCRITNSVVTQSSYKKDLVLISKPTAINPTLSCSPLASFDIPTVCEDSPVTFSNHSMHATDFQWQIDGTPLSAETDFTHTFLEAGTYLLTLTATDTEDCSDVLTQSVAVHPNLNNASLDIGMDQHLCLNNTLSAPLSTNIGGMYDYVWWWNNGVVSNEMNLTAENTGEYILQVTDQCGNQQSDTLFVFLDDNCVWPGDFNYDGRVNVYDLLPYGTNFGATGPVRENASLNWWGQTCLDWNGETEEHNSNLKHIDGNGNGLIEGTDTIAILQNYSQTHGIPSPVTIDHSIVLELRSSTEDTHTIRDSSSIQNIDLDLFKNSEEDVTVYGLAFTLAYTTSIGDVESVSLNLDNSWLGDIHTDLNAIFHHYPDSNKVDIAITRINHQNKTGSGSLGVLKVMIDNLASNDPVNMYFTAQNIQLSLSNGNLMGIYDSEQTFNLYAPPCLDEINMEYTASDFIPTFTQGVDSIRIGDLNGEGNVALLSGRRTHFIAKENIEILPGTSIHKGAVFEAVIGDCETTTVEKQSTEHKPPMIADANLQFQIAPNPFSNQMTIQYNLYEDSPVSLTLYDIHGRIIKKILHQAEQKAGKYRYKLNFTSCPLQAGVYLCKIDTEKEQVIRRIVKMD